MCDLRDLCDELKQITRASKVQSDSVRLFTESTHFQLKSPPSILAILLTPSSLGHLQFTSGSESKTHQC